MNPSPKVAFVHDWLTVPGGGERVLEAMVALYPEAPIYTTIYNAKNFTDSPISEHEIRTSFLDRLPFARRRHRAYVPLMPVVVEQFDLRGYDVVISSSHSVAHGILPLPDQLHINYIHSPARYAWHQYHAYLSNWGRGEGVTLRLARIFLHYLRTWDYAAAARVDHFVANSHWTSRAVRRAYQREAQVIYPPVRTDLFHPSPDRKDYFLTVARLVAYKRVDLIVTAFNALGLPLVVVGDGPEYKRLVKKAGINVRFIRQASDEEIARLMGEARAFVYAAEEDFGIAAVEAQAAGCPVIGYGRGGLAETVINGRTGLLFHEQSVASLEEALRRFEKEERQFDSSAIRANSERFCTKRFQTEFQNYIEARVKRSREL